MERKISAMKCKDCKYKNNVTNTDETGCAICSYPSSWFPVHIDDNCHYILEKKELTCGDCARLGEDFACLDCLAEDSAYGDDALCSGFVDKKEEELSKILMFWKVHDFYDRERINDLIDRFEESYRKIMEQ